MEMITMDQYTELVQSLSSLRSKTLLDKAVKAVKVIRIREKLKTFCNNLNTEDYYLSFEDLMNFTKFVQLLQFGQTDGSSTEIATRNTVMTVDNVTCTIDTYRTGYIVMRINCLSKDLTLIVDFSSANKSKAIVANFKYKRPNKPNRSFILSITYYRTLKSSVKALDNLTIEQELQLKCNSIVVASIVSLLETMVETKLKKKDGV